VDNPDRADPSAVEDITDQVAEELWDAGATALRTQLAESTWHAWFQGVRAVQLDGDILVLAVPSTVACERIRSSCGGLLDDTLRDATGRLSRRVAHVEDTVQAAGGSLGALDPQERDRLWDAAKAAKV